MKTSRIGAALAAALMAAALSGAGTTASAAQAPVAGIVIDVKGKPTLTRKGEDKSQRVRMNRYVHDGDVVKTGAGERVAVALLAGSEVRINENSEFTIETGGSGGKSPSLFTRAGQAWTRMLHGKSGLSIRTPVAVAAVRGTEADVDVPDPSRMGVKVYEGHVDLENKQGRTSLYAGMMAQAAAGEAPGKAQKMGSGDYGSWQTGLDPRDIEGALQKLHKEAGTDRDVSGCFRTPDGKLKCFDLKLKKQ